jgi:hypothetical protein
LENVDWKHYDLVKADQWWSGAALGWSMDCMRLYHNIDTVKEFITGYCEGNTIRSKDFVMKKLQTGMSNFASRF